MELGEAALASEEVRVLGALVEKHLATPQYYPLTLNALVNACNQTSNREPVVAYDERTVEDALASLREKGLIRIVHSVHNRATKYRHVLDEVFAVESSELAVLCVMMLRGPQTLAELRTRTERLAEFDGVDEIDKTLDRLAAREPPLVVRLPRQPGQKEPRTAQLLAGDVDLDALAAEPPPSGPRTATADRIAALEDEVRSLREELAELRRLVEPRQ